MSKTDFFDDDLVKKHEGTKRIRMGPADETGGAPVDEHRTSADMPSRPVSDLNLTRMAKHKEEVGAQVAHAMEELERLRSRQEDLEREKQGLEELRRQQHEYESGKRELVTRLNKSLVKVEKDELKAEQLAETLGSTRLQFREFLVELDALHEEEWPEDQIREELNKALARIDGVRVEYNKSISRLENLHVDASASAASQSPMVFEDGDRSDDSQRSFGDWFKIGMAITLPLALLLIALLGAIVYMMRIGVII